MFNPYLTTAENFAAVLARHEDAAARQNNGACIGHTIVSTPNGKMYGEKGHIPCDHSVIFHYPEQK